MDNHSSRLGQLTDKGIDRAYWWATHKVMLRRIATVVLAVIGAVTVAYGAFGFIDWYFLSGVREKRDIAALTTNTINFSAFRQAFAPQSLGVGPASLLSSNGDYDAFVSVTNPNIRWWATFDYQFVIGGVTTPLRGGFILPGNSITLTSLANKSGGEVPSGAQIQITNLTWKRVNPHQIQPTYTAWARDRLNFSVTNSAVGPVQNGGVSGNRVVTTIKNDTAFSYYRVNVVFTLWSGSQVVGVQEVPLSNFRAGETRQVEAAWLGSLGAVSKIDTQLTVNIFDPQAYIPPGQ